MDASQRQRDTISPSCINFALFMESQPRSAANLSTGWTSHACCNGQNHGKIQVTQYASCIHRLWKGSSCSLPTKRSLHAAIEARIDCLLVILSQSVTDRTRWAIFSPSSHLHQFSDIIIHHRRLSRTMSYGHGAFGAPRNRVTDWAPTPISTSFGAEEIGWQALGPAIACTILATTVVVLRWYTRYRLAQCTGVDDIVILFSMVCAHGKSFNRPRLTRYSRRSHGVCAPSSAWKETRD